MAAFTRSILIGLQAGSRYRLLHGRYWIIVGPRGPIPSTLRPTQADAIAALGGVRWPRRGHVALPVSLAADEPRPSVSRRAASGCKNCGEIDALATSPRKRRPIQRSTYV